VSLINLIGLATGDLNNDSTSSPDEEEVLLWGGSRPGKAPNKNRDFVGAHKTLVKHYFSGEGSVFNEIDFERRFRMPRAIFNQIHDALVVAGEPPFVQKYSTMGSKSPGIAPLCRLVACLPKLCYGDLLWRF
jgi:hypothetical protein